MVGEWAPLHTKSGHRFWNHEFFAPKYCCKCKDMESTARETCPISDEEYVNSHPESVREYIRSYRFNGVLPKRK